MTSQILDQNQETLKYYQQRGRLANWARTIATQALQRGANDQMKNIEAQSASARRALWGEKSSSSGDDMGDTYLGDVQIHQQLPQPPQQKGGGLILPLACAAMGALGPAGAVGGYLLNQMMQHQDIPTAGQIEQQSAPETTFRDSDFRIQLLQESDLLPPDPAR